MTEQKYGLNYSPLNPPPVRWDEEREKRGAAPPRPFRCPVKGCPRIWSRGPDRLCDEHKNAGEIEAAQVRLAAYECGQPGQDEEDDQ